MIAYPRTSAQSLNSAQNDISRGIDDVRKRLEEADNAIGQGGDKKGDARQQSLCPQIGEGDLKSISFALWL